MHTTKNYIEYLKEAFLIIVIDRFSPKLKQQVIAPKKVYVVDNGLVVAKAIRHSPDRGKLMENLVFTELVKRGAKPNRNLFYYKTRNDREVDFVIKKELEILELIQVCYDANGPEAEEREVKALLEASEELKVKKLTVLTWAEEHEVEKDGKTIKFKPLWKWLLNQDKE